MATLYFTTITSRRKSSGKLGIYLAVAHKRDVRYISTEFEIDDDYQFDNGKVCYRKDANVINKRMQYVMSEYQDRLKSIDINRIKDCAQLKQALLAEEQTDCLITVSELFDRRISQLRKDNRLKYAEMNEYSRNVIISILKDTPIIYITRNDIKILEKEMFKRGYSNCNVQMRMAHFKAAINDAIDSDLLKLEDHPFRGYKMPASEVRLMDISRKEITTILNHTCISSRAAVGKDFWLLSFYLGGINLTDMLGNDMSKEVLEYQRSKTRNKKTGNKDTVLSISPEAHEIILRYIGKDGRISTPYSGSYRNTCIYINKCLKILAAETGINAERFSFYSARKTFAQFAFELGIRTEVIEYCLGQSMKSNRPVYNYVRVMQKYADEAIRAVIDYAHGRTGTEASAM